MFELATASAHRSAIMAHSTPTVFVIDDDVSVRESLEALIRSCGWQPETFSCAQEFLARPRVSAPGCLLLDISLPDLNGLDVQKRIAIDRIEMPIIFITGHCNVPMAVQAMKSGAVEFLTKPLDDEILLGAIRFAISRSGADLINGTEQQTLRDRYMSLTRREREVMAWVVSGRLNKQTAGELCIAEITVKVHRRSVMRKMQARSLPDLVLMAAMLRFLSVPDTPSPDGLLASDASQDSIDQSRLLITGRSSCLAPLGRVEACRDLHK
jgi:FixJ family two-component response regulator